MVLVFFSLSPGKRGVYILPALPALAIAALPFIEALLARAGVRRAGLILAGCSSSPAAVLAMALARASAKFAVEAHRRRRIFGSATAIYVYLAALRRGAC